MFKRKLDSEPAAESLKKYELVVDYCACMVAIVIARQKVDVSNANLQWSASQLEQSLNSTTLGNNPDYYINGLALSHGFLMFRKDLVRRGINVVEIFQEEKCIPCYHDKKFSRMSLEIKFTAYHEPHLAEVDLLRYILQLRNDILKRNRYEQSPYSSPSLVFGVIQINRMKNRSTKDMETNTNATTANFRKSPSYLAERSIKNVTAKVINSVEGVVGEKHSLYFLKSAVKVLDFKNRKNNKGGSDSEDRGSDSEEEENNLDPNNSEYEDYLNDERLRTIIDDVPAKNIIFCAEDIRNILTVFDTVKLIVEEKNQQKNTAQIVNKSAAITVDVMSKHTYYSQLTTRAVRRWYGARGKNNAKPGRKVDVSFESEVWGKLMLCVFERSSTNVSIIVYNI
jgi:hypothetical protein